MDCRFRKLSENHTQFDVDYLLALEVSRDPFEKE